ncbi:hypothetical protein D3C79_826930 [compost metagenome]
MKTPGSGVIEKIEQFEVIRHAKRTHGVPHPDKAHWRRAAGMERLPVFIDLFHRALGSITFLVGPVNAQPGFSWFDTRQVQQTTTEKGAKAASGECAATETVKVNVGPLFIVVRQPIVSTANMPGDAGADGATGDRPDDTSLAADTRVVVFVVIGEGNCVVNLEDV